MPELITVETGVGAIGVDQLASLLFALIESKEIEVHFLAHQSDLEFVVLEESLRNVVPVGEEAVGGNAVRVFPDFLVEKGRKIQVSHVDVLLFVLLFNDLGDFPATPNVLLVAQVDVLSDKEVRRLPDQIPLFVFLLPLEVDFLGLSVQQIVHYFFDDFVEVEGGAEVSFVSDFPVALGTLDEVDQVFEETNLAEGVSADRRHCLHDQVETNRADEVVFFMADLGDVGHFGVFLLFFLLVCLLYFLLSLNLLFLHIIFLIVCLI